MKIYSILEKYINVLQKEVKIRDKENIEYNNFFSWYWNYINSIIH